MPQTRPNSTEFHPDFHSLADRWEAWWRGENDTALIYRSEMPPAADAPSGKLFDLLDAPEAWVEGRERQFRAERRFGDAVPSIRVDIGPVAVGAFIGAPIEFSAAQNTIWQHPILDEVGDALTLRLDEQNEWWQRVQALTHALAARAAGRYCVCMPDLSGPIDLLANLRGSENLCMDLFEEREKILAAAEHLTGIWHQVYQRLNQIVNDAGAASVHWLGCWSDTVYTVPTCDFNALIGPDDFRELCLPSYRRQADLAGRVCIHLDGPDAARHAPALAETPEFTAIQYTPGAGTPSALAKLDMFRLLQEAGKPLLIITPPEEAEAVTRELKPAGLALWTVPC